MHILLKLRTRLWRSHWSPLRTELRNLRRNFDRDECRLAEAAREFWDRGGVCCPSCGVPGYSQLVSKQERRWRRINEIEQKLARDGSKTE